MFSKVCKSLVLIYLVFMMMPGSALAADLTQPTMEDMLREELDKPVTEEGLLEDLKNAANGADEMVVETPDGEKITIPTDELDPLTTHILDLCPELTQGEYSAIQTMMAEQLNTPNGQNNYQFYLLHLSDSPEIIKAYGMTASEVVEKLPNAPESRACKDFDRTINDYGHMTSDEKIEFLLTQTPGLETTMKILDKADNNKKNYIFQETNPQANKVQTLADELGSLSTDDIVSNANEVKKDAEELEKAEAEYHHAVSLADKKYDVYEKKPEKKDNVSSDYDAKSYQNILKANKELDNKGKIFNMNETNKQWVPETDINRGDLLQLRVTNSNVSNAFPMFKYMVVRDEHPLYYSCEDLSLKVVDIEGNEIPIEEGKEGEGAPYQIDLEPNKDHNDRKMVSKKFVQDTHDQYALLLNKTPYREADVRDLFSTVPVGIEELNKRIGKLTPKTPQHEIESLTAEINSAKTMWISGTLITSLGIGICIIGVVTAVWTLGVGALILGIGGVFLSIGATMTAMGVDKENSFKRALDTAHTNDNKRKDELKNLFNDIDAYNQYTHMPKTL